MEEEYNLTLSARKLGKLYPVLKDKKGNIIDGFNRRNADPDWPSVTIESVDTEQKLELARLAANYCRREIPGTEIENRISFLIKSGLKPEEISEETGISIRTIYRHMPPTERSKAISEAKSEIARQNVTPVTTSSKISDTEPVEGDHYHVPTTSPNTHMRNSSERQPPERTDSVPCGNCKIPTYISRMRTLDLCPLCIERLTKMNTTKEA